MPTPHDKQIEQVKHMVSWILENGSNPNQTFYIGTTGAYSLTAGYADNGVSGIPDSEKQGEKTVLLQVD